MVRYYKAAKVAHPDKDMQGGHDMYAVAAAYKTLKKHRRLYDAYAQQRQDMATTHVVRWVPGGARPEIEYTVLVSGHVQYASPRQYGFRASPACSGACCKAVREAACDQDRKNEEAHQAKEKEAENEAKRRKTD